MNTTTTLNEYYAPAELNTKPLRLARLLAETLMTQDSQSAHADLLRGWLQSQIPGVSTDITFDYEVFASGLRGKSIMSFDVDLNTVTDEEKANMLNRVAQQLSFSQKTEFLNIRIFVHDGVRSYIQVHPNNTWTLHRFVAPGRPRDTTVTGTPYEVVQQTLGCFTK